MSSKRHRLLRLAKKVIMRALDFFDPPKPPIVAPCPSCGADLIATHKARRYIDGLNIFACNCGYASAWTETEENKFFLVYGSDPEIGIRLLGEALE